MSQEMQVDSNMDCSQISRDTIETAICNLLEKNKPLEEKIAHYEQLKLDEVILSVNDQPGTDDKSKDELSQTHMWLEMLHQRLQIEMGHDRQGDSSMDCSPISRDRIDTDVSNLLERNQQLEEKIEQYKQLKLSDLTQSGKSQHVFHDLSQEELAQTHRWLENLHQRLQFEMVLEGQAESIMDFRKVSRDTIDTDISKLVEIKQKLERQIQQFNQLMEPEVTPSGKSQAGAADRDHDELYPNNSFENIIPMICNKMNQEYEEDCNMDCSNVFPHGNDIYVVMPRQQPMEGMLEHLRQLKQAEETPANKKLLCMTMEQKSKPEYGLAQLEMQVTATKVEPGKKTPLENKNKRQLKSHGPVFIMDKRQQVPNSETQKEKQTRPHLTPLKGRTTKPKTKTQR